MSMVKFDLAMIQQCSSEYKSEADDLQAIIAKMDATLNRIKEGWEGESMRSFDERYASEFKPNLQKARDLVQEIGQAVEEVRNKAEEFDRNMRM